MKTTMTEMTAFRSDPAPQGDGELRTDCSQIDVGWECIHLDRDGRETRSVITEICFLSGDASLHLDTASDLVNA